MPAGKRLISCSLTAVLAGISSTLAAQPVNSGWYVGASAGRAYYGLSPSIVLDSDASGASQQFFVGYRFNRNFSVEGAYVDLGEARRVLGWPPGIAGICVIDAISPCNGNLRETTAATAYTVAAVGTIPITDRFGIFGKLGIANIEVTRIESQYVSQHSGDKRTRPTYGVGIRYNLTPSLGLRGEWERVTRIFSAGSALQANVQAYSVGVEFQF